MTPWTLRLFNDPETRGRPDRTIWNDSLSEARECVGHTIGLLKGRFPSLKKLGGRNQHQQYQSVYALATVHNLFLQWGDNAQEIEGFDAEAFAAVEARHMEDADNRACENDQAEAESAWQYFNVNNASAIRAQGKHFREICLDHLLSVRQ